MDAVLERADRIAARAREIVAELGLTERWSKVGAPVSVGALRYGLMVARDIDMEVYSESPEIADGFAVMSGVASLPGVSEVRFVNAMDTPDRGFYWRTDFLDRDGERWKIDCWHVGDDHPDAHWCEKFADAMEKALTTETRRAILELKEAARKGDPGILGIDIYRAVLKDRVRSAEELREWLGRNRSESMSHWLPEPGE